MTELLIDKMKKTKNNEAFYVHEHWNGVGH